MAASARSQRDFSIGSSALPPARERPSLTVFGV
jgi:hypothetical protein